MCDHFRSDGRAVGNRHGRVHDLRRDHRLEDRRLALDDEVGPASQFAKLFDTALDQEPVAATNDGLSVRQGLATTLALE